MHAVAVMIGLTRVLIPILSHNQHLGVGLCLCCVLQIPSDKVPFNQLPDMKAYEITEAGKEALRSGKYKMVGSVAQDGWHPRCRMVGTVRLGKAV